MVIYVRAAVSVRIERAHNAMYRNNAMGSAPPDCHRVSRMMENTPVLVAIVHTDERHFVSIELPCLLFTCSLLFLSACFRVLSLLDFYLFKLIPRLIIMDLFILCNFCCYFFLLTQSF